MKKLIDRGLLLARKAVFYGTVVGIKLLALLLSLGIAFCLMFVVCYVNVVHVPELEAPITALTSDDMRQAVARSVTIWQTCSAGIMVVALLLLFDAWGYVLYWVEPDYFDSKTASKHAAFHKRVQ
jgi:hypothetical protein